MLSSSQTLTSLPLHAPELRGAAHADGIPRRHGLTAHLETAAPRDNGDTALRRLPASDSDSDSDSVPSPTGGAALPSAVTRSAAPPRRRPGLRRVLRQRHPPHVRPGGHPAGLGPAGGLSLIADARAGPGRPGPEAAAGPLMGLGRAAAGARRRSPREARAGSRREERERESVRPFKAGAGRARVRAARGPWAASGGPRACASAPPRPARQNPDGRAGRMGTGSRAAARSGDSSGGPWAAGRQGAPACAPPAPAEKVYPTAGPGGPGRAGIAARAIRVTVTAASRRKPADARVPLVGMAGQRCGPALAP